MSNLLKLMKKRIRGFSMEAASLWRYLGVLGGLYGSETREVFLKLVDYNGLTNARSLSAYTQFSAAKVVKKFEKEYEFMVQRSRNGSLLPNETEEELQKDLEAKKQMFAEHKILVCFAVFFFFRLLCEIILICLF